MNQGPQVLRERNNFPPRIAVTDHSNGNVKNTQFRGRRGSSSKRARLENDESISTDESKEAPRRRTVVGTSDSIASGRKMKSPPADIFVWGVHRETTPEDIVNDLATSGIIITANDIQKKSKNEATLCSYKISIPAADFQKALNPEIWPLRVKVREYFYNSRKSKPQNQQHQNATQNGSENQQQQPQVPMPGQQQVFSQQEELVQVSNIPTENRYDILGNAAVDTSNL